MAKTPLSLAQQLELVKRNKKETPSVEGKDHIRIHSQSKTELGRMLTLTWVAAFEVPHLGEFSSAICFANWVCSGGDDRARHDTKYRVKETIPVFNDFALYAKFFQLCSVVKSLQHVHKKHTGLPFETYRVLSSGVREQEKWRGLPIRLKVMVNHIVNPELGIYADFPWKSNFGNVIDNLKLFIQVIAGEDANVEIALKPVNRHQGKPKAEAPVSQLSSFIAAEKAAEDGIIGLTEPTTPNSVNDGEPVVLEEEAAV